MSSLMRGVSGDDPAGGAGSGVPGPRLVTAPREVRDLRPTGRDTRRRRSPARRSRRRLRKRRARSGPKTARVERREARSGLPRTAASRKRGARLYESAPNEDTASRRSARPSFGAEDTDARQENPGAGTRAGPKKTGLFDIVNRTGRVARMERKRNPGWCHAARPPPHFAPAPCGLRNACRRQRARSRRGRASARPLGCVVLGAA
jgi:hypothetical protein